MAGFTKVFNAEEKGGDEFPTPFFPVVYSDGVLSLTRATPNVKMYFYRMDPHPFAEGGANQVPIAQVVMPNPAFASSMVFLAEQLALLIKEGHVPKEVGESIVKLLK